MRLFLNEAIPGSNLLNKPAIKGKSGDRSKWVSIFPASSRNCVLAVSCLVEIQVSAGASFLLPQKGSSSQCCPSSQAKWWGRQRGHLNPFTWCEPLMRCRTVIKISLAAFLQTPSHSFFIIAKVGVFLYHKDTVPFLWSKGCKNVEQWGHGVSAYCFWRETGKKAWHPPGSLASLSL